MLSIVTVVRPFEWEFDVIQKNAVNNWKSMYPDPQVVLCSGNGIPDEVKRDLEVEYAPVFLHPDNGLPLVDDSFSTILYRARYDIKMHTTSDVLFFNLMDAVKIVSGQLSDFMMVGRRHNLNWEEWPIELVGEGPDDLPGKLDKARMTAVDWFVWRGDWFRPSTMPSFVVGRGRYDNWMVWNARKEGVPVVDATNVVTTVHQNHKKPSGKEVKRNINRNVNLYNTAKGSKSIFGVQHATHVLTGEGVRSK